MWGRCKQLVQPAATGTVPAAAWHAHTTDSPTLAASPQHACRLYQVSRQSHRQQQQPHLQSRLRDWRGMILLPPGCSGSHLHRCGGSTPAPCHRSLTIGCAGTQSYSHNGKRLHRRNSRGNAGALAGNSVPCHIQHHAIQDEPAAARRVQLPDLIEAVQPQAGSGVAQPLLAVLLLIAGAECSAGGPGPHLMCAGTCSTSAAAAAASARQHLQVSQPHMLHLPIPPNRGRQSTQRIMSSSTHLQVSQPQVLRRRQQLRQQMHAKGRRLLAQGQRLQEDEHPGSAGRQRRTMSTAERWLRRAHASTTMSTRR